MFPLVSGVNLVNSAPLAIHWKACVHGMAELERTSPTLSTKDDVIARMSREWDEHVTFLGKRHHESSGRNDFGRRGNTAF